MQLRRELKAAKSAEESARRELLEARSNNAILAHRLNKMGRSNPKVQKGVNSGPSSSASHSPTLLEDDKNASVCILLQFLFLLMKIILIILLYYC